MTNKLDVYVKSVSSNGMVGYILNRNNMETTVRISARLNIDKNIHNAFIKTLVTPYMTVHVNNGVIVAIDTKDGNTIRSEEITDIKQYILKLLQENHKITKGELYKLICSKHTISYKTLQRKLKDMVKEDYGIITNNNWVMYDYDG